MDADVAQIDKALDPGIEDRGEGDAKMRSDFRSERAGQREMGTGRSTKGQQLREHPDRGKGRLRMGGAVVPGTLILRLGEDPQHLLQCCIALPAARKRFVPKAQVAANSGAQDCREAVPEHQLKAPPLEQMSRNLMPHS